MSDFNLSLSGAFKQFGTHYGYGKACEQIAKGFLNNDIETNIADGLSDIELCFDHAPFKFYGKDTYKIAYVAWESTEYPPEWKNLDEPDEYWSPASWLTEQFAKDFGKPVFTFPHGVGKEFTPKRRYRRMKEYGLDRPFTFLHIGEPQYRKNGQLVVDAFVELFGNNPRFRLVMKCGKINSTRIYDDKTKMSLGSPQSLYSNIVSIEDILTEEQLLGLYHESHCFLYPSAGEGFGLQPLEALATGLPTICTSNWAEYSEFINVPIEGVLSESPWQDVHPGNTFNVTVDQVKAAMLDMVENYDEYAKDAFKNAFTIHKEWNWDKQILKAVERLKEIQNSRI